MTLDNSRATRWAKAAGAAILAAALVTSQADAGTPNGDEAMAILKRMTDYVGAQHTISARYDSDIEIVTPDLQKIDFASSGTILLSRPDKARTTRTGGYADVMLNFDGKTLSVLGKNLNAYTQIAAPGTLDNLVDHIRDTTDAALPGADLFLKSSYAELSDGITDAKHVGRGVVAGVECDHLAFRTADVDWQLWVQVGDKPIPRRYVITSKTVAAAPQYTIQIEDWHTDVPLDAAAFTFDPPRGAMRVPPDRLSQIDEIPAGVSIGGR